MSLDTLMNMIPHRNLISLKEPQNQLNRSLKGFIEKELHFVKEENILTNKELCIKCGGKQLSFPIKKTVTTIGKKSFLSRFDIKLDTLQEIFLVIVYHRGFFFLIDASGAEKPSISKKWTCELRENSSVRVAGADVKLKLVTPNIINDDYVDLVAMNRAAINKKELIVDREKQLLEWQVKVLGAMLNNSEYDLWQEILFAFENSNCIRADFVAVDFKVDGERLTLKRNLNKAFNNSQQISGRAITEMRKRKEAVIYGGGFEGSLSFTHIKECLLAPIFKQKKLFSLNVESLQDTNKFKQKLRAKFAKKKLPLANDFLLEDCEDSLIVSSDKKRYFIQKNADVLDVFSEEKEIGGILYFHLANESKNSFTATCKDHVEKMAKLLSTVIEKKALQDRQQLVHKQVVEAATIEPLKLLSSSVYLFSLEGDDVKSDLLAGKTPFAFVEKLQQYGINVKPEYLQLKERNRKYNRDCIYSDYYNNREYFCSFEGRSVKVYSSLFGDYTQNKIFSATREYDIIISNKKGEILSGDCASIMVIGEHVDPKIVIHVLDAQGHSVLSHLYNVEICSFIEGCARSGMSSLEIMRKLNEHLYNKYRHTPFGTKQFAEGMVISIENTYEEEAPVEEAIPIIENKKIDIASSGITCLYGAWISDENRYIVVDIAKENLEEAIRKKDSLCSLDCEIEQLNKKIKSKTRTISKLCKESGHKCLINSKKVLEITDVQKLERMMSSIKKQFSKAGFSEEELEDLENMFEELQQLLANHIVLRDKKEEAKSSFQGSILGCQPPKKYTPSSCTHLLQQEDFIFAVSDGYSSCVENVVSFLSKWLEGNEVGNGEKLIRDFIQIAKEKNFAEEKDDATLVFLKRNEII